jgi:hypothetical protein
VRRKFNLDLVEPRQQCEVVEESNGGAEEDEDEVGE